VGLVDPALPPREKGGESSEADEAAADREEGFVGLGAAVVPDEEPFELVQPGESAFDDPAVAASRDRCGKVTADR